MNGVQTNKTTVRQQKQNNSKATRAKKQKSNKNKTIKQQKQNNSKATKNKTLSK